MATDRSILEGLFAGSNAAFYRFEKDNRDLFEAYFKKRYPNSAIVFSDLYQESIIELWLQIAEGRMTQSKLTVDPSSYLISIGRNKYFEHTRINDKYSKLKRGERVFKKRKATPENPDEEDDVQTHPLQSKKQQRELDTNVNEPAHNIDIKNREVVSPDEETEEEALARRLEKQRRVEEELSKMQEPCKSIIRDTWLNNDLSDEDLVEANKGQFPTVSALRVKRHRCHQKLKAILEPWYKGQLNS